MKNERRFKGLAINHDLLLKLFQIKKDGSVSKLVFPQLPEDTIIHGVWPVYDRQCFIIILFSEEWPEVPDGAVIAEIKTEYKVIKGDTITWHDKKPLF